MIDLYQEKGLLIVDDFLPENIAAEMNDLYSSETSWEKQDQVRENHYQHVFATNSKYFPGPDEPYQAKFDRSFHLEKSERINSIFQEYFIPALKEKSKMDLSTFDIRCYQLKTGDYYRTHMDDYVSNIGCTYYVNKKWIWDWGGILHVGIDNEEGSVTPIFPKYNRAVFIDNGKFRFPHFISAVSEYAQNPRYTLVSFNKD